MKNWSFHSFLPLVMLLLSPALRAQEAPVYPTFFGQGVFLGETLPLRDLPTLTDAEWTEMKERAEYKRLNPKLRYRSYPFASTALPQGPDPVWQNSMGNTENASSTIQVFEGQSSPYYPPDCNGTAGPNHFLQTINTVYAIYSKTGTLLAGPTNLNTVFSGVTGAGCNDGDPIVLYDEQADRWLFTAFSICGSNDYMLVAVSTTNDPTGTWYKYSFDVADMPDYPKFGIWQDGYYLGTNTTPGNDIYVMERSVILAGGTNPKMVGFDNPWRPTTIDGFMCVPPVDNDGAFAPAGSPGLFITINDDAIGGGADQLWIYELTVNWSNTAASTFQRVQQLDVAPFDSNFGNTWNNIPQQGTSQKLDAIPMVVMNVPQYRNFGTFQTLVCCHTVDVDATNHAGIRWYELRKSGTSWTVRQHGTYAPDAQSRWMGSISMNGANEIALGYSISSSSLYPGIRYTGQTQGSYNSANGLLDIPEETLHTGTNSQSGANRWGDYSQMSVDPADDETFWFTTQYIGTGGSRRTKIASLQIGPIAPSASFTASTTLPCLNQTVTFTDQSTGSPTAWVWSFSPATVLYVNGTSATSQNPQVQFTALGNYTVSLTATNAVGNNTHTKTNYIQVNTANADFTANPTTVVVNYSTVFTDASTCNVLSWAWDFGSGASPATASTQGPHTVTYSTLGQKNVTLTVNGTIVQTKNNYINVIADNFTMSNTPVTTCSGNYYDPGGPSAAYGNNLDFTQTFYPAVTGNNIRVIFNSFALEANANCSYDYLKIYNGPNTSSPLLGTWCGNNSPGTQTANNAAGALTFVFHSDNTITAAGWAATISCVGGASVNNPASLSATPVDPNQINLTWALNAGNDNIILAWSPTPSFGTPVNGTQYIAGSTLPGGGTVLYNGNATAYNHTGLTPATTYYYKAFSYNPAINYSTGITANAATPAVTLSVAPANQNVTAPAGNTTFAITSNAAWTAVSDQTWCTVTPSGTGNATLTATFTENTAVTQRIANITVTAAGASPVTVTVTQAGAAPTLAVTPPNQNVSANAGACTFNVASNTNWTAVSSATWCTVTAAGSGNGTLTASYTENTSLSPRVATLTVTVTGLAPVNVTVSQEGAAPYLSVTPSNQNVSAPAGAIAYNVSSNAGWTASSDQTWCTVTPAGTGNGTLTADYLENTYTVQRIANITVIVSGIPPVTVTLTQGGTAPYLTVTPDNQNTGATAGSATYSVGCNQTWSANSNASWCQVTASGNGSGNLMADFTENLSTETRIATLTVTSAGLTPVNVTLTQAGAAPYLSIQPASQTVNPAAGTTLYNITSNASWVAASDAEWCAVTPAGTGNASLTADYEENTTADIRTANISVSVINLPVQVVQLIQLPYTIGIPQDASDFRLYPNPTTGRFIIAGPGTLPFRFQMNIYDENGRCVASDSRKGQNAYAIDLSGQAPGVYTVRAEVDGRELNWKIILK